ncbi:hypothetical protein VFPPC_02732 [Pochonia chlamydosporia 170]|uniref:NmrA-like domain-containing protein n=1 Tax=Pochonia chlamydosporia 170 TaxID=1380566 RepID=A0A179FZ31_METCM|nr:hypothetical protein VFPPC_02732 [Pochonia chlamydosporia 170]OAQ70229.1 hypothetical protein VFPPC_02732 [Pochonia chlamydosporia 170]
MVTIAIAGATSQLAREVLDALVATGKHKIIALIRKNPNDFPPLPGVQWIQTTYEDKTELVRLLQGVHTLLCFYAVHLDPGSETQKRLIDAAVEAGVKRYAPSEWSTGEKLKESTDVLAWYAGKVEISQYLENFNQQKKVLEYTKFQPGAFMNFLAHPRKTSKHVSTISLQIDLQNRTALTVDGRLDAEITYTTVQDIANVVARAVDYEGVWPTVGGIRGHKITARQLLDIAGRVLGQPIRVELLKMEDLAAGELKTENYPRLDLPSIPEDQVEAFSKTATIGVLISISNGVWNVSDEWNRLLPDYEFTQIEDFIRTAWGGEK